MLDAVPTTPLGERQPSIGASGEPCLNGDLSRDAAAAAAAAADVGDADRARLAVWSRSCTRLRNQEFLLPQKD